MAINIIGSILKDEDIYWWKKVLTDLEKAQLKKISFDNVNEEHENLYRVIELSVEYLEKEVKERYLSLSIFHDMDDISTIILETYWGENYLDYISVLLSASLLFKGRDNLTYTLHDLQKDYISINDQRIEVNYKLYIRNYNIKYMNNDIVIPAIEYDFFEKIEKNLSNYYLNLELSENILYGDEYLNIETIKAIIEVLNLNTKNVAKKLLNINKSPNTLNWALHLLGEKSEESRSFANKYLENKNNKNSIILAKCIQILGNSIKLNMYDIENYLKKDFINLEIELLIQYLKYCGSKCEIARNFSEEYLNQEFSDIRSTVAEQCINILGFSSSSVEKYAQNYINENKDSTKLQTLVMIKSLKILGKESLEVREFCEKYINLEKTDNYLLNTSLSLLPKTNEKRKSYAKNALEQGYKKFRKIKSNIQAQILYTEINNKTKEDIVYKLGQYLFNTFNNLADFISNRTLLSAYLTYYVTKPKMTQDFSKIILEQWEREISFRYKNRHCHWHIILALKNKLIMSTSIKIINEILQKNNKLNQEELLTNRNFDYYYISFELDEAIFEVIKSFLKNGLDSGLEEIFLKKDLKKTLNESLIIYDDINKMGTENKLKYHEHVLKLIELF